MNEGKKMGRPKAENPKSNKVTIRLEDERYARLLSYCKEYDLSLSQVLNKALDMLFE